MLLVLLLPRRHEPLPSSDTGISAHLICCPALLVLPADGLQLCTQGILLNLCLIQCPVQRLQAWQEMQ